MVQDVGHGMTATSSEEDSRYKERLPKAMIGPKLYGTV
jgi:hypothetical protein